MELLFHLGYYGMSFFHDGWLVFDFCVVSFSWALTSVNIFRAFRILRTFRLITKFPQMRDLIHALVSVVPRMVAIFLLLMMIYFVFGVMFTELFGTCYQEGYTTEDYFSRLDYTAFTLLQFMLLDNWSSITKEVSQKYSWAWFPILLFIVISTFIVINLIIAVICDAVAAIHSEDMQLKVEEMQHSTENTMEQHHLQEMALLQTKMEEMTKLLAAVQASIERSEDSGRSSGIEHSSSMPGVTTTIVPSQFEDAQIAPNVAEDSERGVLT